MILLQEVLKRLGGIAEGEKFGGRWAFHYLPSSRPIPAGGKETRKYALSEHLRFQKNPGIFNPIVFSYCFQLRRLLYV